MTGSKKTVLGITRVRKLASRFLSRLRPVRPWFDAHLPLIPVPIQSDRAGPAQPNIESKRF